MPVMLPLLPGQKRKYVPPTSRKDPKFEELQKVGGLWGQRFVFWGWG